MLSVMYQKFISIEILAVYQRIFLH